ETPGTVLEPRPNCQRAWIFFMGGNNVRERSREPAEFCQFKQVKNGAAKIGAENGGGKTVRSKNRWGRRLVGRRTVRLTPSGVPLTSHQSLLTSHLIVPRSLVSMKMMSSLNSGA